MRRQSLRKIIAMVLVIGGIFAIAPIGTSAEWKNDSNGWWYTDGNSWSVGWKDINGKRYYFDKNGYMKTGWVQDKNKWYYLNSNGAMVKNTTINGYILDSDGLWIQSTQNRSSGSNTKATKDIGQAISQAIKDKGKDYLKGEVATEGHIILETEEKDNVVKAYTISSFGYFGFENGIFTKISGSGAIPTVMTFSKNANGEYSLINYKEPEDGEAYIDSIKEMFPKTLWEKVSKATESYRELALSEEAQAKEYLKQIHRTAEVKSNYGEKKLPNINIAAENKLFAYLGRNDKFINDCPYWLGTVEKLENGDRMIYETAQSKSNDGYDLITFRKTKADGTVIEKRSYKIVGSEPELQ